MALNDLRQSEPIVDPKTGRPSDYFMAILSGNNLSGLTTEQIVQELVTRQIIAGDGLTGGGDLSADRTLNVGAGTGLTVAADTVSLGDTAVTPGSYTNTNLTVDAQGRLTAASNGSGGGGAGGLTLIEEYVVPPGGTASKTFSTGLSSYKALRLDIMARSEKSATGSNIGVRFNGDTGSNYSRQQSLVTNTSMSSISTQGVTYAFVFGCPGSTAPSGTFCYAVAEIPASNSTAMRKRIVGLVATRTTDAAAGQSMGWAGGEWLNTAAITSVTVYEFDEVAGQDIAEGSIIRLWGMT